MLTSTLIATNQRSAVRLTVVPVTLLSKRKTSRIITLPNRGRVMTLPSTCNLPLTT